MFILSQTYDRVDLLSFVGSKQSQSGIIWGSKEPTCVIVTSGGKGGKSLGYSDVKNPDGSVSYIGQGQKGDQNPKKKSNKLLIDGERTVLFFSAKEPTAKEKREKGNSKKLYRFEGIFEVASWEFIVPEEGKRRGNKLIRFLLLPANNIFNIESKAADSTLPDAKFSLLELRNAILNDNKKPEKGVLQLKEYYRRSRNIVIYAKKRANGICENCNEAAPFVDEFNSPFLEVHHIFRLADDGPDEPQNVAAVCPDCHKEAHYGKNKNEIKFYLETFIKKKEEQFSQQERF